ncbi:hypothetical protein ACTHAM_000866 [Cellulomonas soli]|uniref:hypothetical protein n=1 Tax=Cellulomonas soli TaxID=931535 RepID=UPI003F848026
MSKERKKPAGTMPGRANHWGIVVRLRDGGAYYYYEDPRMRAWDGGPLEAWGRQSQAHQFTSREAAESLAARMQTNSAAKEYLVVQLPKRL